MGCLNDVDHFRGFLTDAFGDRLAPVALTDADATRANVIHGFRAHLGQARAGDVAVFHYCGHGARAMAAPEFAEFFPIGKDEGLVLVDSRQPGGFDLADKELAVLIAELAANGPHIAIVLDCCHSGSGTRDAEDVLGIRARVTDEIATPRALETYLDGYYAALKARGEMLSIPAGRHVLLAACHRTQTAKETADRSGVFTSTLVDVLRQTRGDVTYADLFVRCRAAVLTRADDQTPQFELAQGFDAQSGFLGRAASNTARRYSVHCDAQVWHADCGAVEGLPTDAERPVTFALYPEADETRLAGSARATRVGAQQSELALDFASDPGVRYGAEITSLPVPPLAIAFAGAADARAAMQDALDRDPAVPAMLVDEGAAAGYALLAEGDDLRLTRRPGDRTIQRAAGTPGGPGAAAAAMLPVLKHVAQWERGLALANQRPQLDPALVGLVFDEQRADGQVFSHADGAATLDSIAAGGAWQPVRGKLKARNGAPQTLYFMLVYFSADYGIYVLGNDPVIAGADWVTLWGDGPRDWLEVPGTDVEAIDRFKLVASTEKVDDFLLTLPPLALGATASAERALGGIDPAPPPKITADWFTRDVRLRTAKRLGIIGPTEVALIGGALVVAAHPAFAANLDLGGGDPAGALARAGVVPVDLARGRGGFVSIVELSGIARADALAAQPLDIVLGVAAPANERIVLLADDGARLGACGDVRARDDGTTRILIDRLPDPVPGADGRPPDAGGSLRLRVARTALADADLARLLDPATR